MDTHATPPRVPPIEPVPEGTIRPFWSVMITHYNRRKNYLARALESVLEQDPGADQMEIVVVDDCSPDVDVEPVVREVGKGRVAFHRSPVNAGSLAKAWNNCVRLARGQWVHILHDDDIVLPGFYRRLREGVEGRDEVGAAFCRHAYIDEDDNWGMLSELERRTPGVLEGWIERIAVDQRIQCASIVVRRAVYETIGGYNPELIYTVDWDMWKRIAGSYPVWYEPRPLACFRIHGGSESARLNGAGSTIPDTLKSIELARSYFPSGSADQLARKAREKYASYLIRMAHAAMDRGQARAAFAQVGRALGVSRGPRVGYRLAQFVTSAALLPGRRLLQPLLHPRR